MCQQLEPSFNRIHSALFCKILHTFSVGNPQDSSRLYKTSLYIHPSPPEQKEAGGDIVYTFDKNRLFKNVTCLTLS